MIINTSDYLYLFQRLSPRSQIRNNAPFSGTELETFLRHKSNGTFLRAEVFPFPSEDIELAKETIRSGDFINPFIYAENKSTLLQEQDPLTVLDYNPKNSYLVVNDRSEIIIT